MEPRMFTCLFFGAVTFWVIVGILTGLLGWWVFIGAWIALFVTTLLLARRA